MEQLLVVAENVVRESWRVGRRRGVFYGPHNDTVSGFSPENVANLVREKYRYGRAVGDVFFLFNMKTAFQFSITV